MGCAAGVDGCWGAAVLSGCLVAVAVELPAKAKVLEAKVNSSDCVASDFSGSFSSSENKSADCGEYSCEPARWLSVFASSASF